jgi:hypothetical protein
MLEHETELADVPRAHEEHFRCKTSCLLEESVTVGPGLILQARRHPRKLALIERCILAGGLVGYQ